MTKPQANTCAPVMVLSILQVPKSHILRVASSEQVQNLRSVGAKQMPWTFSLWAGITFRSSKLGFQYFINPLSSPEIRKCSLWLKRIAWTPNSWACNRQEWASAQYNSSTKLFVSEPWHSGSTLLQSRCTTMMRMNRIEWTHPSALVCVSISAIE